MLLVSWDCRISACTSSRKKKETEASEMSEVTLAAVDPTPDDVQYLEDRIYEFNSSATGIGDGEWLAFFVRAHDRIVAGICLEKRGGRVWYPGSINKHN